MQVISLSVLSYKNLLLEFPVLPAHGALMLGLLSSQPLHDAMDVEAVAALTPHLGNRYATMSTYSRAAAQEQQESTPGSASDSSPAAAGKKHRSSRKEWQEQQDSSPGAVGNKRGSNRKHQ